MLAKHEADVAKAKEEAAAERERVSAEAAKDVAALQKVRGGC